jgi:hypothetical protein
VLSSQEQRVWDDVVRFWAAEVEEPPRSAPSRRKGASRDDRDLPAAVVAGTWVTIAVVLLGAVVAGLAVGLATALGWALWRYWPLMRGLGSPCTPPESGYGRTEHGPADTRCH